MAVGYRLPLLGPVGVFPFPCWTPLCSRAAFPLLSLLSLKDCSLDFVPLDFNFSSCSPECQMPRDCCPQFITVPWLSSSPKESSKIAALWCECFLMVKLVPAPMPAPQSGYCGCTEQCSSGQCLRRTHGCPHSHSCESSFTQAVVEEAGRVWIIVGFFVAASRLSSKMCECTFPASLPLLLRAQLFQSFDTVESSLWAFKPFYFCVFKTGSHYIVLDGLELAL